MSVLSLSLNKLENYKKQQYQKIYHHEALHKSAGGIYAGPIVIEKDSNGIATAGHVDIQMPVLDKKNPDKTIKHAQTVIKSALAPQDPSEQDYKVASKAKAILDQAQNLKRGKKLDVLA